MNKVVFEGKWKEMRGQNRKENAWTFRLRKKNAYIPRIMHTILSIVSGLIGFFTFTEEDKLEAGIFTEKNGQ